MSGTIKSSRSRKSKNIRSRLLRKNSKNLKKKKQKKQSKELSDRREEKESSTENLKESVGEMEAEMARLNDCLTELGVGIVT